MQLSGAWAIERYIKERTLEQDVTAIDSRRGNSSHEHNPFMILRRKHTNEYRGEAIGFSLIYSGNFRIQAEVDTHNVTRVTVGINPEGFDWKLEAGEMFQTPEAVMVYSENGLNGMSQTFHKLYGRRLARGYWRDRCRPILIYTENIRTGCYRHRDGEYLMEDINMYWIFQGKKLWTIFMG